MNLNAEKEPRVDTIVQKLSDAHEQWISIEFFPPKTPEGVENLFKHRDNLQKYKPLFIDMTWGAGGSTSDMTIDLCHRMVTEGHRVNMHLTCTNMEVSKIDRALASCKEYGIHNILALRGDPPVGQAVWVAGEGGFASALDLVKHIRSHYHEDEFCVSVAGYPEGHPSVISTYTSYDDMTISEQSRSSVELNDAGEKVYLSCSDADYIKEIAYLKEKIDAGSNAIITQMFFDVEVYVLFVKACRAAGITVPIIPGIMCIASYSGFKRMAKFCKTRVPAQMEMMIEAVKEDDEAMRKLGVELGVEMSQRLLQAGAPGLHFYTLNSSVATSAILERLQL